MTMINIRRTFVYRALRYLRLTFVYRALRYLRLTFVYRASRYFRLALCFAVLMSSLASAQAFAGEPLGPPPTQAQAERDAEVRALIEARRAAMREELEAAKVPTPVAATHKEPNRSLFGESVSIFADTAIVGAYMDDVDDRVGQGSAVVYVRQGKTWKQQARLLATDGAAFDHFGKAVSIFADTALVGASDANGKRGCAYIFKRRNGQWQQEAKLLAGDGAIGDLFGASVALSGDTALVGAWLDDVGEGVDQGSAYVFRRTGDRWQFEEKLVASKNVMNSGFGYSVSLSGSAALIGARRGAQNFSQGSAYVFQRSGKAWLQQAKLTASDGHAQDQFGYSVAIDGELAVIGDGHHQVNGKPRQGAAYVFQRTGDSWQEKAILIASNGAADDQFGKSVAISGRSILVGAALRGAKGSAYLFDQHDQRWSQSAELVANDAEIGDSFAGSVSLAGNSALIGAPNYFIGGKTTLGKVYVLVRDGKKWSEQAKLRELQDVSE
jgi:putative transposon-encoded protein